MVFVLAIDALAQPTTLISLASLGAFSTLRSTEKEWQQLTGYNMNKWQGVKSSKYELGLRPMIPVIGGTVTIALLLFALLWAGRTLAAVEQSHRADAKQDALITPVTAGKQFVVSDSRRVHALMQLSPRNGVANSASFQVTISSTVVITDLLDAVSVSLHRGTEQTKLTLLPSTQPLQAPPTAFAARGVRWQTGMVSETLVIHTQITATTELTRTESWRLELFDLPEATTVTITVEDDQITGDRITAVEADPIVVVTQTTHLLTQPALVTLSGYGMRNIHPPTSAGCDVIEMEWQAIGGTATITTTSRSTFIGGKRVCLTTGKLPVAATTANGEYGYSLSGEVGEFSNQAQAVVELAVPPTSTPTRTPTPTITPTPTNTPTHTPTATSTPPLVTLAAGAIHNCYLTISGGVKCWGGNIYGQLGDGTGGEFNSKQLAPVNVVGLSSGVHAIFAAEHTCALTTEGGIKCWGSNSGGQLGDGAIGNMRRKPVDLEGLQSDISAIAAGGSHTCALTTGGGVKCWGWNGTGQLGDGTGGGEFNYRLTPVDVVDLSSGVEAIAAGGSHTCALTTGGSVKCWGWNYFGQLGDGTRGDIGNWALTPVDVVNLSSGVEAIAAGGSHTCALTTGGSVKCWGWNYFGQLGDGTAGEDRLTPVNVVGMSSGIQAIAAGENHTCALTTEGDVRCWGNNSSGQLGDGTVGGNRLAPGNVAGIESRVNAIAAGGSHTCVLMSVDRVQCWGNNYWGQLGIGSEGGNYPTPVDVLWPE